MGLPHKRKQNKYYTSQSAIFWPLNTRVAPRHVKSTPAPNVSNDTEFECMEVATSGAAIASGDMVQPESGSQELDTTVKSHEYASGDWVQLERGSQEFDTTVKSHPHPVMEVQLEADVHALESGNSDNKMPMIV